MFVYVAFHSFIGFSGHNVPSWLLLRIFNTFFTAMSFVFIHRGVFVLRATVLAGLPGVGWPLAHHKMPPKESKPLGTRPV